MGDINSIYELIEKINVFDVSKISAQSKTIHHAAEANYGHQATSTVV